ncbi:MAG: TraR/DksA C4-type zinc finger protein [Parcubacteria group bacterium]
MAINAKDLKEIQTKLLDEKKNLEAELEKVAQKTAHNGEHLEARFEEYGADETDSASEVVKFGLNLTLEKTLEKSLKDVEKALTSIKKGTYGTCKYCKQPIDIKRLKARPTSSACISCKTKLKSM